MALITAGLPIQFVVSEPAGDTPTVAEAHGIPVIHYSGGQGITGKRNFILDYFGARSKIVVLDDDLRFAVWDAEIDGLRVCSSEELREGIYALWSLMDQYPLAGFMSRFGARAAPKQRVITPGKVHHVLGHNFSLIDGEVPRYQGRLTSDADMNLQILTRGYETALLAEFTHDDVPDAAGGCSLYRTPEMRTEEMVEFCKRWPGIAEITASGGKRISWKKAVAVGRTKR